MIHNFQELSTELGRKDRQLADFVDASNANFAAFAAQQGNLSEAVSLFPAALSQTATTLTDVNALAAKLGPTLEGLRPFARELAPSLRRQRPFLRDTTPIIQKQIRPFARDVQPTARDLRTATKELAPVTPGLTRSFKVLNAFFNTLAYDPPGDNQSYLFWSGWAAHAGTTLTSPPGRSRADAPGNGAGHLRQLQHPREPRPGEPAAGDAHPPRELPERHDALPQHPVQAGDRAPGATTVRMTQ